MGKKLDFVPFTNKKDNVLGAGSKGGKSNMKANTKGQSGVNHKQVNIKRGQ